MSEGQLEEQLKSGQELFVQQKKEWTEIIVDFETSNKYAIMDSEKNILGMIAERGGGFMKVIKRMIFRSHRALEIDVIDQAGKIVLHLSRAFFFFFSDLTLTDRNGQVIGSIHRRFGIIHKRYDLKDKHNRLFATIKSPIWRLWTFPIYPSQGQTQQGEISKKWGGALREIFTDADVFRVSFGQHPWTPDQRLVIFAASVSIDFDFFENNQGQGGLIGG